MRKLFFNILISIICICSILSGCASDSSSSQETDAYGNNIFVYDGHRTTMIDALPYDLVYNDNNISLVDVSFFEDVVDYSYNLFIVTTLDVSNLNDSQLHWLRESDLDVNVYLTNEKNGYDFYSSSFLGSLLLTDSKQLIFVHTSSFNKENRYSFSGSDLSLTITATQEETFEHKFDDGHISELNKTEELHYRGVIEEDLPDTEAIEEPLYSYVAKWLRNKADFYGSLS